MLKACRAILGLALLLAMIGDSSGQSPPEPPRQNPNGAQQRTNTEQRDTDQAPPSVIKQLRAEQAQQKSTNDEQKGPEKPSDAWTLSDKIAAIASIAALLQFFALVITIFVLMRTATRQLRAYVFISGAHLENIGVGQIPCAQLTIKNLGQTPAYKLTQWAMVGIGKFPLGGSHPPTNESDPLPERPLPPQDEIQLQSPKYKKPLDVETLDELSKGMLAIYVVGEIRYRDAFKKKWRTRYLLYSGGSIGLSGRLAAYKEWNDAT
jgi:hypothetical protein